VAWPSALLALAAVILLSIMTAVAPLVWKRTEIDDSPTGESIASCTSDEFGSFIWTLGLIMFILTALTGLMAWKTHDVDTSYSDSFWVMVLMVVQIESY